MSAIEYTMKFDQLPLSRRLDVMGTMGVKDALRDSKKPPKNIENLTHNGVDFIDPDSGMTPLLIACMQGKPQIVRVLIDRGADLLFTEKSKGRNALLIAAKFGKVECVNEVMRRGGIVNSTDKFDMTPLMHACKGGHYACMASLLSRGASINSTDDHGFTAVHYAAKFGHTKVVEHLHECGASLEIRELVEGKTPLHLAAQYGRKDTVAALLECSAKVNRRSTFEKFTALMLSAKEGHKAICSMLISKGADANLVDIFGWSPLHFATSWGRRETALILIVEGHANVNSREETAKEEGGTPPLVIAAKGRQLEVMKLLLNYGADPNFCEMVNGDPPLAVAARLGYPEILQCLLDYGADINHKNALTGTTALMLTCAAGRRSGVITLLNNYADINILDDRSWNALMHATKNRHRDILLSAMVHISASAKVNLIPWIEQECPTMIRGSLGGSPSVFLNSTLYLHKGIYHGLLHTSHDCDVYLIYALIMIIAACKRSSHHDPSDRPDLLSKITEIEQMLALCVSARNMCHDSVFTDCFVIGLRPCAALGNYDIRYFASAFFSGPLALYVENNLATFLDTPQVSDKIDRSFWSCLRDPGESIEEYGTRTTILHSRYCPALMFIYEGVGKLLVLIVIIWNCTIAKSPDSFYSSSSSSGGGGFDTSELIAALMIVSMSVYEVGLIEEKRWAISPSIVFHFKELERRRLWNAATHFVQDPFRFCDLLTCSFGLIWLVIAVTAGGRSSSLSATGQLFLISATIPLSIGLIRYPGLFYKPLGVQILNVFLIIRDLLNFFAIFALTGVGFGAVFYGVFRGGGSSSGVDIFKSPYRCLETLFNAVLKNYETDIFEGSGNHQFGVVVGAGFMFWAVFILFNAVIAHMASNYSATQREASEWWILSKARYVQQYVLALEKSPLCMLPPPLNLISAAVYVFHVYYAWRARLYSRKMYCISLGGAVSDYVLLIVFLAPVVVFEYVSRILSADIGSGIKLILLLGSPVGLLFCASCLLYKFIKEPFAKLIVKTRISDGRLRVSYGAKRDALENDSLAHFEDERMYKYLGNFKHRAFDAETVDSMDDEAGSKRSAGAGSSTSRSRSGSRGSGNSSKESDSEYEDEDEEGDEEEEEEEDREDEESNDRRNSSTILKSLAKYLPARKKTYTGKKVRVTPYSPFLQLGSVHSIEQAQRGSSAAAAARLPPRYRRSIRKLTAVQLTQQKMMQERARRGNDSLAGKADTRTSQTPQERPPVLLLDNGHISAYQPGFESQQQLVQFNEYPDYERDIAHDLAAGLPDGVAGALPTTALQQAVIFGNEVAAEQRPQTQNSNFLYEDNNDANSALVVYGDDQYGTVASSPMKNANPEFNRTSNSMRGHPMSSAIAAGVAAATAATGGGGSTGDSGRARFLGKVGPLPGGAVLDPSNALTGEPVDEGQVQEDIRQMAIPSFYFTKNKFAPILLDHERRRIFKIVLPEEFVDDFSASVRDTELYIEDAGNKMAAMEKRLEMQSRLLQQVLQRLG